MQVTATDAAAHVDHRPHDIAIMLDGSQIGLHVVPLRFVGIVSPPAERRIVVMRPGINHGIGHITVRQVQMPTPIPKSKLQDPHSRKPKGLPQLVHFGRNQSKVFRDKRQLTEDFLEPPEQRYSRRLYPLTIHRRRLIGSNRPVRLKPSEVIQPHLVVKRQRPTDTSHPPVKPMLFQELPLIKRIPPQLPGLEK